MSSERLFQTTGPATQNARLIFDSWAINYLLTDLLIYVLLTYFSK